MIVRGVINILLLVNEWWEYCFTLLIIVKHEDEIQTSLVKYERVTQIIFEPIICFGKFPKSRRKFTHKNYLWIPHFSKSSYTTISNNIKNS